jgi:UDPglucose 6-dehydrogenase
MLVCVYGLWQLGTVTAACLSEHFQVIACDPDNHTISKLRSGVVPVFEPGLQELIEVSLASARLSFTESINEAARDADIIWVTFDTPVKDDDTADIEFVRQQLMLLFPSLRNEALVLISSQVPVGFTSWADSTFRKLYPDRRVTFAYSPENLRLGKGLSSFRNPARVVIGLQHRGSDRRLVDLFSPFCETIEWMSLESAEMTKHALNAFLATSVTFINELATLCEKTGADAHEVARGLKTEPRIGSHAYLNPGAAFAGGTLARDVVFLNQIASDKGVAAYLFSSVLLSNNEHKKWSRQKLDELLSGVVGKTIAVLGLTYKPHTDTLRRSSAVELCISLNKSGARVKAFDPVIKDLPTEIKKHVLLCSSPREALSQADAVVVATEWPVFRSLSRADFSEEMNSPVVIDPNRFLLSALGTGNRLQYFSVGTPSGGQ